MSFSPTTPGDDEAEVNAQLHATVASQLNESILKKAAEADQHLKSTLTGTAGESGRLTAGFNPDAATAGATAAAFAQQAEELTQARNGADKLSKPKVAASAPLLPDVPGKTVFGKKSDKNRVLSEADRAMSPLQIAYSRGHDEIVRLLLSRGALP